MGTRGAFGFIKNGVEKVTYNHFDSYPDGLGQSILADLAGVNIEKLNEAFDRIELVSNDKEPTAEQIEECRDLADKSVSTQRLSEWYVLLRKAQGCIGVYWAKNPLPYMINGKDFLQDSLFCEFAYIVNLDTNQLEFYRGFNEKPGGAGRYAGLKREREQGSPVPTYYGVVLKLEIPLRDIIKETVKSLVKKMEQACNEEYEEVIEESPAIKKINKNEVDAYFSAQDTMVQMEVDLPNELIDSMKNLANEWTEEFGRKVEISDALGILLTKITKEDFEEIVKKYK